ncbi:histidine kinase [Novosphingobium sp. FKTRR1]|uniref:histidine kinase n=1 Tax=Novosphingobium sp. FKTRR1 TaxID=2879118 RepID=UPI001CF0263D|nr:histidine kinase [Novosphingobium sp. FKTRR1]
MSSPSAPSTDVARDTGTEQASRPHVPARQVLKSAATLWLAYLVLVTLRALLVDLGDFQDLLWRRALVTLAGIGVTLLAWPVLRHFDGRSTGVRISAALVIMLPAALVLAIVNQQAFAPVEQRWQAQEAAQAGGRHAAPNASAPKAAITGSSPDLSGNVLIDGPMKALPAPPPEPAEPHAPAPPAEPAPPEAPTGDAKAAADGESQVTIVRNGDGSSEIRTGGLIVHSEPERATPDPSPEPASTAAVAAIAGLASDDLWKQLTDVAMGRYFLLIAWAALYLALGNAEMVRAVERREGEYRRAAKAAELRSLRYQVNPHFLFNTLNSLSALVMVGRNEQAERMIQTISSFYRASLAGDPTSDVPLADEIALQQHYLEIETVRFPERLRVEFAVPPALENAHVPGMILQPLVENSIKYAVSATTRPVTIRIAAREVAGFLLLTVADDGPGKPAGQGGTGIGLANVQSRLQARYGNAAQVESGPLPAGGYATVLTIPLDRGELASV